MPLLTSMNMEEVNRILEMDQITLKPKMRGPLEKVIKSLEELSHPFTRINLFVTTDGEFEADHYLKFSFRVAKLSFNFRVTNGAISYNSYKFCNDELSHVVGIATSDCLIESGCQYLTANEMSITKEIINIFDIVRASTEKMHMDILAIKEEIEFAAAEETAGSGIEYDSELQEGVCEVDDYFGQISPEIAITSKLLLSVIEDNNLPTPQTVYSQTTSFVFNWVRKNSNGKTNSLYLTVEGSKIHVLVSTLEKIIKRKTVHFDRGDIDKYWDEIKIVIERFYSSEI